MNSTYKYIILCIFFLPIGLINAQSDTLYNDETLKYEPAIAGGQIEATTLLYEFEWGALLDFDFFKKHSITDFSLGTRIGFTSYSLLDFGGADQSYNDYYLSLYFSARGEKFHLNFLGGLSNHKRINNSSTYQLLPSVGFEIRYNLAGKVLAIIFKGATTIGDRNSSAGYAGIGIAFGFYR